MATIINNLTWFVFKNICRQMLNNALDTLDKCWSTLEDIINPHYLDNDAWKWEALQPYYKSKSVRFFILIQRWKLSTHRVLVLEIGSGKSGSSMLNNRDIVNFWAFMFLHHTHGGLKSIFFAGVKQVLQKDTLRLCSRLQLFLTLNLRWYVH